MTQRIERIPSSSGHELLLTFREPASTPKGVVQVHTGTCIPQKIYWKFAEYLTANGYITITYDYSDAANYTSDISHQRGSWIWNPHSNSP